MDADIPEDTCARATLRTMTTETKLSPKRLAFVNAYATNGGNGAQAYRDAGYKSDTDNVAAAGASRLLRSVKVSTAIQRREHRLQAVTEVTRLDVIAGLTAIAQSDEPASARVSAWSKIADILGLVTRKTEITDSRNPMRDQLAGMTLDAVLALMERMETELDALPAGDVIDSDGEETDVETCYRAP